MQLLVCRVIAASFAFALPLLACAQGWPVRPIRLIVNSAPGVGVDVATRAFAPQLSEALGQSVVVDNCAGAGGRPRAVNRVPACGM